MKSPQKFGISKRIILRFPNTRLLALLSAHHDIIAHHNQTIPLLPINLDQKPTSHNSRKQISLRPIRLLPSKWMLTHPQTIPLPIADFLVLTLHPILGNKLPPTPLPLKAPTHSAAPQAINTTHATGPLPKNPSASPSLSPISPWRMTISPNRSPCKNKISMFLMTFSRPTPPLLSSPTTTTRLPPSPAHEKLAISLVNPYGLKIAFLLKQNYLLSTNNLLPTIRLFQLPHSLTFRRSPKIYAPPSAKPLTLFLPIGTLPPMLPLPSLTPASISPKLRPHKHTTLAHNPAATSTQRHPFLMPLQPKEASAIPQESAAPLNRIPILIRLRPNNPPLPARIPSPTRKKTRQIIQRCKSF